MSVKVAVRCLEGADKNAAQAVASALGVTLGAMDVDDVYRLDFSSLGASLVSCAGKHGPVYVDFIAGGSAHRRKYGGGKGQAIAKALGVTGAFRPKIFDATAGLGGDAFVLACLGCEVVMMERSPVAYALLADGLARARQYAQTHDPELAEVIGRMQLRPGDSTEFLSKAPTPVADVAYLDPMFPERNKKALVKKEMQAFHNVIGYDTDEVVLLAAARRAVTYRTVVKRPRLAPNLANESPSYSLSGKSSRFDIYTRKALPI